MKLLVERKWKKDSYTIGVLSVDGVRFCETVEDKDRGLRQDMNEMAVKMMKIAGVTAIPTGTYNVALSVSPKFKAKEWAKKYEGLVPEIVGVKGFSGVRIHPANYATELEGCIAPGENKVKGGVINSTKNYYLLMDKYLIPAYERGEQISLTII